MNSLNDVDWASWFNSLFEILYWIIISLIQPLLD